MAENKALFEMETAWPFPIIQYTVSTSYVEVRKASGIAFIILQLISAAENRSEKLVATLRSLGVPGDIHYIFAEESANMINYGIVQMKSGREYGSELVDMYDISDFEITELGRKLFAEGTIPTGNTQIKRISVYYDVSRKDTQIKYDDKLFRFENSTLDESDIGTVILNNSDVELFISENMPKFGFRKGERISGFGHDEPELFVSKIDDAVKLIINEDKLCIKAKDKDRDGFIHANYSIDTICKIIDAKRKFHFPESLESALVEKNLNELGKVVRIGLPSQLEAITNVKTPLSLNGLCKVKEAECSINDDEASVIMNKCDINGVACYFEGGELFSIIPGRFLTVVDGISGKLPLNLVVVKQFDYETSQHVLREIFLRCIDGSDPISNSEIIKRLTHISGQKDYIEQYALSLLKREDSNADKIDVLLNINSAFKREKDWDDFAKLRAAELFDELCSETNVTNFSMQNSLGRKLNTIMELHDIDYLSKLSTNILEKTDEVVSFDTIVGAGYDTDVALSIVNVFKLYCAQILSQTSVSGNSKLSNECVLLGQSLHELSEVTGISDPYLDSAYIDIDDDRFVKVMATFTSSYKKLEKYKAYAMDEYKTIASFYDRFVEIKEVISIEKDAQKNPKNINKKYIDQKLKKSKYKDSICDLHVRLQYELNRLFMKEHVSTYELLSDPGMTEYLTEDEISSMHSLRMCRNGFQHPKKKRDTQYSEKMIRDWCQIVEKLGGIANEPRS